MNYIIIKSTHFFRLKERVVFLYKVLCDLTGHSPVKRRKVKLKVLEGHPTEPVKKLEKFLNDIGTDGAPPFPDFNDVLKCVTDANVESSLCWTKQDILKEGRLNYKILNINTIRLYSAQILHCFNYFFFKVVMFSVLITAWLLLLEWLVHSLSRSLSLRPVVDVL